MLNIASKPLPNLIIESELEPGVINMKMVNEAIIEQGPKGEAGRLFVEEGYDISKITRLRLEFFNILRIDHLWMLTGLTKLQLCNNIIEKIENLDALVNLVELDLSFNQIEVIENLNMLEKIEVLTFFDNKIKVLENIDSMVDLRIFSIGNNLIEDWDCIRYLRQFHQLRSLNMAGNPCASKEHFRDFVSAYIPQLVYYEYKLILSDERLTAHEKYINDLQNIEEAEEKAAKAEVLAAAVAVEVAKHAEAFVELLDGDQLYESMMAEDEDGKVFMAMGEEAEECFETLRTSMREIVQKLFQVGQEQLLIRQHEVEQFQTCVQETKEKSRIESQELMEDFLGEKADIFYHINSILHMDEELTSDNTDWYAQKMSGLTEEFHNLCQNTWTLLMEKELVLFEQLGELNTTFDRSLLEMVNAFIEMAQGYFVQLRDEEANFSETLMEQAYRYLTHFTIRNEDISTLPVALRPIMVDKEIVTSTLGASHDSHLLAIDNREDRLISRIRDWHNELCGNLQNNELKRDRLVVLEISHFLDLQREEFEELQTGLLDDEDLMMQSGERASNVFTPEVGAEDIAETTAEPVLETVAEAALEAVPEAEIESTEAS